MKRPYWIYIILVCAAAIVFCCSYIGSICTPRSCHLGQLLNSSASSVVYAKGNEGYNLVLVASKAEVKSNPHAYVDVEVIGFLGHLKKRVCFSELKECNWVPVNDRENDASYILFYDDAFSLLLSDEHVAFVKIAASGLKLKNAPLWVTYLQHHRDWNSETVKCFMVP